MKLTKQNEQDKEIKNEFAEKTLFNAVLTLATMGYGSDAINEIVHKAHLKVGRESL